MNFSVGQNSWEMNHSELFDFLASMTEDERSLVHTASTLERILIRLILFVCGLWGSFTKLFLLYNLAKEKHSERPINILIIIDQSVDFMTNMMIIFNTIAKVSRIN